MSLKTAGFVALSCILLSSASGAAQPQDGAPAEAPVEIPFAGGEWVYHDSTTGPLPTRRSPALWYQAQVFPRMTQPLLAIECLSDGLARVEVTGLIPAQSFPQPAVALRIGDRRWSATPNALYTPRSQPGAPSRIPNSKLDDNLKGRDLSWPGHPPYASLRFFTQRDNPVVAVLAAGGEVQVEFERQQRRFPAVPREMAERFVRTCAAVTPFG